MYDRQLELKYNQLHNAALELRLAQEAYLSRPKDMSIEDRERLGRRVAEAAIKVDAALGRKGKIFDSSRDVIQPN